MSTASCPSPAASSSLEHISALMCLRPLRSRSPCLQNHPIGDDIQNVTVTSQSTTAPAPACPSPAAASEVLVRRVYRCSDRPSDPGRLIPGPLTGASAPRRLRPFSVGPWAWCLQWGHLGSCVESLWFLVKRTVHIKSCTNLACHPL